ncbi:hypothetical protein [Simkania negevensis]|uniref:Uncharacterized protein n=1 Tax=Simkania negevensis (strain ATCC VR-1471 / DSM 27360 / Z) TaxID=331113 RepID=F8L6K8_SIMNZ|nr:hypothetical protein [Simkania negevensis]MCB1066765.1 hypothetical protein [Simkania sp.]MCB1075877.1 hypothetical protein [Simkania sp.]MCP5490079.1 hypothetical protein [Chlamydiales bacterium]CCB88353.1 unknown protein [Simkania negevensis Z]
MEDHSYTVNFLVHLVDVLIKSVGGGIGFAFLALEVKKAWKQERKWKLALAIGAAIFGVYILFVGI